MARREYQAGRPTTLSVALNIGGTSFTIANDTNWPDGADYDFWVTIDAGTAQEERVLCSSRSGTTVTVATGGRGSDGTQESNHAIGATIWPSWSATDADEANVHIESTGYASYSKVVHGLGSSDGVVVGTDKAQTLTAKTLTSPTISNPTITGTITGTGVVSSANIVDGTIADVDISGSAAIAQSKISGLVTDLGNKVDETNGAVTTASTSAGVVRNIYLSTSASASGGIDGDVWLTYIP
jgi:hypothetical protein